MKNLCFRSLKVRHCFPQTLCFSCTSQQCVLGRHLREIPGEKAKLQQASRSLLQGITRLLELGEECITEGQMSQVHSRSQLQAALCRREVSHCAFNKFFNRQARTRFKQGTFLKGCRSLLVEFKGMSSAKTTLNKWWLDFALLLLWFALVMMLWFAN